MKNNKLIISFCIILVLSLTGCTTKTNDVTTTSSTLEDTLYTFTDDSNTSVSVAYEPQNVAVLFPSYADVWLNAGGKIAITVDDTVERGYAKSEDVVIAGSDSGNDINLEVLLAAQPDFVILTTDYPSHVELAKSLRDNGIPTALFQVDSFDQYLNMLKIFTDIFNNPDAYEQYGVAVDKNIQTILDKVANTESHSLVLLLRAFSTGAKAKTDDNFVGSMLKELGTDNIAEHAKTLLEELSIESILTENPDYIFVTTMGDEQAAIDYMDNLMTEDPAWNTLSAIQNNKYIILPKDLFQYKPNARWDKAYEYLAKILYPEAFEVE